MSKDKNKAHKQPPIHYGKKEKTNNHHNASTTSSKLTPAATQTHKQPCKDVIVRPMPKEADTPLDFTKSISLQFSAVDTLFFRETRPMESQGELQSVFPPSVRTLAGAVRSWIGEGWLDETEKPTDWKDFSEKEDYPLRKIIGFGDDLGDLKFQGAWLNLAGERLYPTPLNLMKTKQDELFFLKLDQPIECDLGKKVRLATFPSNEERYKGGKALENTWLTAADLSKVLEGNAPNQKIDIKKADKLFERESRLGIARDNQKRGVIEGLLYQTQHVRPNTELLVELDVVAGLPEMPAQTVVRLGGEGRPAQIKLAQQTTPLLTTIEAAAIKNNKLALYLLTPLPIQTKEILPNFTKQEYPEQTVWVGELNGVSLKLHGAVTGKVLREGGWDMAKHAPRKVTNFIPAGSVFYLELMDGSTAKQALSALHNQQIGTFTEYGFGHVAVGVWNDKSKD
ncbi:type III-B CRISPR module-associated protein Cmr3 [uncultured Thiothrix sp.]|uniref:type III-B CRISPR module-associated protein Cmr3 n=1 Tax=uncultured Thiothrix sp. TaxID=223185 RepID=UPI0026377DE6|nr:type III-B CRISPR module-associated protein Cmr3 [uncultured Thiothrix sp.]